MTPEKEIKELQEQNQVLKDKIDELDKNRMHCRQCHSTDYTLKNKNVTTEFNHYELVCKKCGFVDIRYIDHNECL